MNAARKLATRNPLNPPGTTSTMSRAYASSGWVAAGSSTSEQSAASSHGHTPTK